MPIGKSPVDRVILFTSYNGLTVGGNTTVTPDVNGMIWLQFYVGDIVELAVDVLVTFVGGASPTLVISVDRYLGDDATVDANTLAGSGAVSSGAFASLSVGRGMATARPNARYVRVRWGSITGAPTSFSLVVSVIGKAKH